jgi:hypothetical protein
MTADAFRKELQHMWQRETIRVLYLHGHQAVYAFNPQDELCLTARKRKLEVLFENS